MKEKVLKAKAGIPRLILFILLYLAAIALIIYGGSCSTEEQAESADYFWP